MYTYRESASTDLQTQNGRIMKPYPHKCPKCRQQAFAPAVVSRTVVYRYDGKDFRLEISNLPVLSCGQCGFEAHTNETEDCIIAKLRGTLQLLSPSQIESQRLALGLTQKRLARLISTSEESISRWESGLVIQSRSMNKLLQLYLFVPEMRSLVSTSGIFGVEDDKDPSWSFTTVRGRLVSTNYKFPVSSNWKEKVA
jgi:putative zinc finger/helix-turn-helix YgiT family protein